MEYNSSAMPNTGIKAGIMKTLKEGSIKILPSRYVFTGTEKAGDIINIGILPAGSEIIPFLSYMNGNEPTAKATIEGYVGFTAMNAHTCLAANATANDFDIVKNDVVLKARLDATASKDKEVVFLIAYRQL